MAEAKKFFVYGTLKVGGRFGMNFDAVRKSCVSAVLPGFELYNLGWFPSIFTGDGEVKGEVHEYDHEEEVLQAIDRIEGFRKDAPQTSLFLRSTAKVKLASGEEVDAIIYTLNGDRPASARKIASGVWPIGDVPL